MGAGGRSGRRQDRRLSVRALESRGPEVAPLDELLQADLQDRGRGQTAVHALGTGAPLRRKEVLLARSGEGRQGGLGALERNLELHGKGAELSAGGHDRRRGAALEAESLGRQGD